MEKYKGREYPDVLIEVLIEFLDLLRPGPMPGDLNPGIARGDSVIEKWRSLRNPPIRRKFDVRRRVARLRSVLRTMSSDPQVLTHTVHRDRARSSGAAVDFAIEATYKAQRAQAKVQRSRSASDRSEADGTFEEQKIERLQAFAIEISGLLRDLVATSPEGYAIVFLDDYYFVPLDEQPAVLGYLHQVCKGTGVWLKVGGVGSRLNTFKDGNPPTGMEVGQDVSSVVIDVTLAEFATAQRFLEEVLGGILAEFGLAPKDLFTDDARSRMILACGGAVARDYITLTESALDQAVERMSKSDAYGKESVVKIWTVDIQSAAKGLANVKEKEAFRRDAGSDASALSSRWKDIGDFTRNTEGIFILVPQIQLEREAWGHEVQQLENLRLIHRIGDTTPNAKSWQGVKVTVFMIDLGQLPTMRLAKAIPEFWHSAADFNNLRRAGWIYTPSWRTGSLPPAQ